MSQVTDVLNDMVTKLQSIADLKGVVFPSYDPADLAKQVATAVTPWVGVTYEGTRSVPGAEAGSHARRGKSTIASFAIYLTLDTPNFGPDEDAKGYAIDFLDQMRNLLLGMQCIVNMQYYNFIFEGLVESKKDRSVWVQRWQLPVMYVPS